MLSAAAPSPQEGRGVPTSSPKVPAISRRHRSLTLPSCRPQPRRQHGQVAIAAAGAEASLVDHAAPVKHAEAVGLLHHRSREDELVLAQLDSAAIRRRRPAGPRRRPAARGRRSRSSSMSQLKGPPPSVTVAIGACLSGKVGSRRPRPWAAVFRSGGGEDSRVEKTSPGASRTRVAPTPTVAGRRESPLFWGSPRSEKTIFEGKEDRPR
jgi:hypothetical protein